MTVGNSYFDDLADLSVDEIMAESDLLEAVAEEKLPGTQAYDLLFTPQQHDSLVVGYELDYAPGLDEKVQKVAEFGEIPVGDPEKAEKKYADLDKFAVGLRVSHEQRTYGSGAVIQRELLGRLAEIRRANSLAAVTALEDANIETFAAPAKWNTADALAMDDIYAADDLLAGAKDVRGNLFNYSGRYIWGNRRSLNALKRNKQVAEHYVGDMAHANPLFADIANQPLIGEQFELIMDQALEDGVVFVFADNTAGSVGTLFQTGEPVFTDWYAERGDSELGGSTMSWRSDWVHFRHLAVRAPKSIVKITGVI